MDVAVYAREEALFFWRELFAESLFYSVFILVIIIGYEMKFRHKTKTTAILLSVAIIMLMLIFVPTLVVLWFPAVGLTLDSIHPQMIEVQGIIEKEINLYHQYLIKIDNGWYLLPFKMRNQAEEGGYYQGYCLRYSRYIINPDILS